MSFLNQLKSQAHALQAQRGQQQADVEHNTQQAEEACRRCWHYLQDLARQLNVIGPAGPAFTLDGKTPWPAMKLQDFRTDARKKMLRDREVYDHVVMGWEVVPQMGGKVGGSVSVNFPPDLERVQQRLALGNVQHERKEVRHPEKNTLLALRFDYEAHTRGNVRFTADHDNGQIACRVLNANGFGLINLAWPAAQLQSDSLDELAKLIVGQPSRLA